MTNMWEIYVKSIEDEIDLKKDISAQLGIEVDGIFRRLYVLGTTCLEGITPYAIIYGGFHTPCTYLSFEKKNGKALNLIEQKPINFIKCNSELKRWGKELRMFSPTRRKKAPEEILMDHLIFEFKEMGKDHYKVQLPGDKTIYKLYNGAQFMDRFPTALELRVQELRFQNKKSFKDGSYNPSITDVMPLYYFLGNNAEKVLKNHPLSDFIKFNIWDVLADKMEYKDFSVDEALLVLESVIYDGQWESGYAADETNKNHLHSDYFYEFMDKPQVKIDKNIDKISLIDGVFRQQLDSAFKAIELYKKYQDLLPRITERLLNLSNEKNEPVGGSIKIDEGYKWRDESRGAATFPQSLSRILRRAT